MTAIDSLLSSPLTREPSGVWLREGHRDFAYADGAEGYVRQIIEGATDISDGSVELERSARDWPTEYHLTRKRTQLLSGFEFDREARVLEVGAGCGSITRFLGERFRNVVAVEGSMARAQVARLRTRDLDGVHIVCSPFQQIEVQRPFDIVFCIGVLEYSASFVGGADPYGVALDHFRALLAPDGILIVAIENQFGHKYLNGAHEDHVGRPYEGIEGYPRSGSKVRTFGRLDLRSMLRKRFDNVQLFYPFPDYKLPDVVIDEGLLEDGRAAELVAGVTAREHVGGRARSWDARLAVGELARNGLLPDLANSFLAVAGPNEPSRARFPQRAIMYSPSRSGRFRAQTRVVESGGRLSVEKSPFSGEETVNHGSLTLRSLGGPWLEGPSLATVLYRRWFDRTLTPEVLFDPCKAWLSALQGAAGGPNGTLPGEAIDRTWGNAYVVGSACSFIDEEWRYCARLPLRSVVLRSIYSFIRENEHLLDIAPWARGLSGRAAMLRIARAIGLEVEARDVDEFIRLESEFQSLAHGIEPTVTLRRLTWFLGNRDLMRSARGLLRWTRLVRQGIARVVPARLRSARGRIGAIGTPKAQ